MFTELQRLTPPEWADIDGQPCLKYASISYAMLHSVPAIGSLIRQILDTLPVDTVASTLVDVRCWKRLAIGDIPGVPGWHYDVTNKSGVNVQETHRLYFVGAGCRTMFRDAAGNIVQPTESTIVAYGHDDIHCIAPATTSGPRLFIRCSQAHIRPANCKYQTAYIHEVST